MSAELEIDLLSYPGITRRLKYLQNKMQEVTNSAEDTGSIHYSADLVLVQLVMALAKGHSDEALIYETLETWAQHNLITRHYASERELAHSSHPA